MKPTITSFSLTLNGLIISYMSSDKTTTLKYDAKSACNLMEAAGMIEGFDLDKNGEPVIYYTENIYGRKAPAYCLWCDYVKTFRFIQRHAEILVEYLVVTKQIRKSIARINYLLKPLKAA